MTKAHTVLIALLALCACQSQPGRITKDGEVFAQIAPEVAISAGGTEPFWSLAIPPADPQGMHQATYSTPEDIEGASVTLTRFAGNNGLGFSGEMDGTLVMLAITPGECSDAMSDRTYPYVAILGLGEEQRIGCAYTSEEPFTGEELQ